MLVYEMPLNEIVLDFYDRSNRHRGLRVAGLPPVRIPASQLVKMDVLVRRSVDALSIIVHKEFAYERGGR